MNRRDKLADFYVPNKIQPKEYSKGGDKDGFSRENIPVLRAVNVNWNGDGWNVNANSVENPNEWNAGNRVFSRYCCFLPSFGGSFA